MLALMLSILLAIVVVGTAALAGHPFYLVAAGLVLGGGVLLLARRHSGRVAVRRDR